MNDDTDDKGFLPEGVPTSNEWRTCCEILERMLGRCDAMIGQLGEIRVAVMGGER